MIGNLELDTLNHNEDIMQSCNNVWIDPNVQQWPWNAPQTIPQAPIVTYTTSHIPTPADIEIDFAENGYVVTYQTKTYIAESSEALRNLIVELRNK